MASPVASTGTRPVVRVDDLEVQVKMDSPSTIYILYYLRLGLGKSSGGPLKLNNDIALEICDSAKLPKASVNYRQYITPLSPKFGDISPLGTIAVLRNLLRRIVRLHQYKYIIVLISPKFLDISPLGTLAVLRNLLSRIVHLQQYNDIICIR
ncbi:hypothetical protein AB3S75_001688 [Citrus x aurantiifolia]